jgi:hypothetical protein
MIKFKDMAIGQRFFAWGDCVLNYNYPKWCLLEKVDESTAKEIMADGSDGIKTGMETAGSFIPEVKHVFLVEVSVLNPIDKPGTIQGHVEKFLQNVNDLQTQIGSSSNFTIKLLDKSGSV